MSLVRNKTRESETIKKYDPQKIKSYFIILLALLLANGIILFTAYSQARSQMYNTSKELIINRMNDNIENIDRSLVFYQQTLYSLSVDENVFWLKNWYEYDDLQRLKLYSNVTKRIQSIKIPDANILNLYACYPLSNIVIDNGLYQLDNYDTLSKDEWSSLNTVEPNIFIDISVTKESGNIESFIMVHKIGAVVEKVGFLVMEINPSLILDIFKSTNNLKNEAINVRMANGDQLYNTGNLSQEKFDEILEHLQGNSSGIVTIDKKEYYIVTDTIKITNWQYTTAIPVKNLIKGNMFNTSMWLIILTCIIIALICVFIGINIAFRPIEKLYNLATLHSAKPLQPNRGIYLERVFDRIFSENDGLRANINRNLPLLREKVLMQIIMRTETENVNTELLDNLKINFSHDFFRIAVVSYDIEESSNAIGMLKVEVFNEFWKEYLEKQGKVYIVLFEPHKFFFVINYSDKNKDSKYWRQWFTGVNDKFKEEFSCYITGGMSLVKTSINTLNAAFIEALKTFERQIIVGPGFVEIYDQHNRFHKHQITYPFEILQKLTNILKTQDHDKANLIIDEFETYINNNPPRNQFALRQILLYMSDALRNLLLDTGIDEEVCEQLDRECLKKIEDGNLKEYIKSLKKLAYKIQDTYRDYYSNGRHEMIVKIKEFIEDNYPGRLTPNDIAKQFYISPTYLYRMMKHEISITPAHYVTKIRCEKAAEKLKISDLSVKKIASICGFDSNQSFYRNFRKAFGCTPSQYRKLNQITKRTVE